MSEVVNTDNSKCRIEQKYVNILLLSANHAFSNLVENRVNTRYIPSANSHSIRTFIAPDSPNFTIQRLKENVHKIIMKQLVLNSKENPYICSGKLL